MKKLLPIFAALTAWSWLRAGYYIQQKSYILKEGQRKESTTQIWMEGENLRMESPTRITIVNYGSQKVYFVNKSRKTYYAMTLPQLKELLSTMVEMMKRMGADVSPKIEITGEKKVVKGYHCTVVLMKLGSLQTMEQCLSPDVRISMADYMKVLEVMLPREMMEELRARKKKLEALGFPVYSRTSSSYMGRSTVTETYLEKYRRGPIPPEVFTVPPGYRKTEYSSPFSRR